ncbi:MAG: hypothetical protein JNL74_17895 [Fibrobacteres bacterium]|nr:hypothetical protein [Fibrobacterota bacterium]
MNCEQISNYILGDLKPLSNAEQQEWHKHLSTCSKCCKLNDSSNILNLVSKIPKNTTLRPNAHIREVLVARIMELSKHKSTKDSFKSILAYSVPIYKIAAVLLFAFVGFMGYRNIYITSKSIATNENSVITCDSLIEISKPIQVGIAVKNDSVKALCDSLLM